MRCWTIADLLGRGVVLQAHEAVAIAQQLIDHDGQRDELTPPLGPPTIENVEIDDGGTVRCRQSDVTPAVSEIGALLDVMLPRATPARVPGALRYAVARALHEVDAPPFDSLEAFAATLARYGHETPRRVVRQLAARIPAAATTPVIPHVVFAEPAHVPPPLTPVQQPVVERRHPRSTSRASWFLIGATAAAVSFSATYVGVLHHRIQRGPAPTAAAAATAVGSSGRQVPELPSSERSRQRSTSGELSALSGRRPTDRDVPQHATSSPDRSLESASADDDPSALSPAFASSGTAIFEDARRKTDAESAVAETRLNADLAVMTILDDGAKNYHVQPSPDGTRIAFDSDRDGQRGVYVAARDGSNVHRVSGPGYAAVPSWSPDGEQLAFIRGEPDRPGVWNLWLTRLSTAETRRLTNFSRGQIWNASWFADGARVAYTHDDALVILRLGDGTTQTFPSPVPGRPLRTPAVSPDGRRVVFQVWGNGAWLLDVSDGSMRCVLTDPTAEQFAWSPDGRRIAFHSQKQDRWDLLILAP